ncbi:MAG: DUF3149 domain-containing protein [Pseudobdellovibrio sp.]
MVNKLVVSLLVILFALGVVIYFRSEFKYKMVENNQDGRLVKELKTASIMPATPELSKEDRIYGVMEKNDIKFASDYLIVEDYLFKACSPDCLNSSSFYRNYMKIIEKVQVKRLWIVRQNKLKDKVSYFIQDKEEKQFLNDFSKKRALISDQYAQIKTNENKQMALELVKVIDSKIAELKKK